jgi:hypothetical protein
VSSQTPVLQVSLGPQQTWPLPPHSTQRAGSGPTGFMQVVPDLEQNAIAPTPQQAWFKPPHWTPTGPQVPSALQVPESCPQTVPAATHSWSVSRHTPTPQTFPPQLGCPTAPQAAQFPPMQAWLAS